MNTTAEIIEKLKRIEIFSDFSEDTEHNSRILEQISSILTKQTFKAGDEIIVEGESEDTLHILAEGNVNIYKKTLQDEHFLVAKLNAEHNVFFGEMSLISHAERSATVVAATDCTTLMITGTDYSALCEKEPLFGYKSLRKVSLRVTDLLRKTSNDVKILYQALLEEVEHID